MIYNFLANGSVYLVKSDIERYIGRINEYGEWLPKYAMYKDISESIRGELRKKIVLWACNKIDWIPDMCYFNFAGFTANDSDWNNKIHTWSTQLRDRVIKEATPQEKNGLELTNDQL